MGVELGEEITGGGWGYGRCPAGLRDWTGGCGRLPMIGTSSLAHKQMAGPPGPSLSRAGSSKLTVTANGKEKAMRGRERVSQR